MTLKPETQVDRARQIIADLEKKRVDTAGRIANIGNERALLSYDAHTGCGKSAASLDKLNRDAALAGAELESIDAALIEAKRRLAAAIDAANDDKLREKADRVADLVEDFRAAGAAVDAGCEALKADISTLLALGSEISALSGTSGPSRPVLSVNLKLALAAHLHGLLDLGYVAGPSRQTACDVTEKALSAAEAWSLGIRHPKQEAA
ncbi:MAG: hypothetical protein WCO00_08820 [Rhodospirillaceae bacterium]